MTARVKTDHAGRKTVTLDVRSTELIEACQRDYYVRNGVKLPVKVLIRYALYLYRQQQIRDDGGEAGQ